MEQTTNSGHWHCPRVEDGLSNTQKHFNALIAHLKDQAQQAQAQQASLAEPSEQDSTLACDLEGKLREQCERWLRDIQASTNEQVQELEIRLSKMNSELQTKTDECAGLQHQLNTIQKTMVQVDVDHQHSTERIHKLHEMNVKAAEERVAADHEEKISDLEAVVKQLTSNIDVLKTEHTSREAALHAEAEADIAKIQQQLQAKILELEAKEAKILELEAKDQLSQKMLEAKDEELRAKHHECDMKSEELLKKIEEHTEFQERTSERIASLRSSYEEIIRNYQAESRSFQESLQERTTTSITTVTTDVGSNELQDRMASLREENISKGEENLQLRHENARLQNECVLYKDKVVPLLQQIASNEEALQEAASRAAEAEQHTRNQHVELLSMIHGMHGVMTTAFASASGASMSRRSSVASLAKATQEGDAEVSAISTASEGSPDEAPPMSDSDE